MTEKLIRFRKQWTPPSSHLCILPVVAVGLMKPVCVFDCVKAQSGRNTNRPLLSVLLTWLVHKFRVWEPITPCSSKPLGDPLSDTLSWQSRMPHTSEANAIPVCHHIRFDWPSASLSFLAAETHGYSFDSGKQSLFLLGGPFRTITDTSKAL